MNKIKKLIAFTLAETLIVMGIIGVVAALTIPNVNKNTGRAETVAKVKKIYAELAQAQDRATAVYGPLNTWFTNDGCANNSDCSNARNRYFDRITEFMKISKNCGTTLSGCMPTSTKFLNGNNWGSMDSTTHPRAILAGGLSFRGSDFYGKYTSSSSTLYGYKTNGVGGYIYVDIDGPNKGKNTWGIDLFMFVVTTDGIYPRGGGDGYWKDDNMKGYCFYRGTECAAWVINTGNMDYLDADSTGKCKHSNKTLSIDNNVFSCK